ncbi:MAG TPA: 4-hydroxy-2-oxovalerate aldolase [Ruminiclostridium sp.]
MIKSVKIIDTTLRDGMHAVSHSFSPENVANLVRKLVEAGSNIIELSHGDGLNGSSIQYGLSPYNERELLAAANKNIGNAKLAAMLIPGIGTVKYLESLQEYNIKIVRVATHVTEANAGEQHIKECKKMGMTTIGFLMMVHMVSAEAILEQAKLFESYGADVVYCADSSGAMLPDDVKKKIGMLKDNLKIPVGFHAHNNLGLAVGNSLAAIEAGVDFIDTTLRGIGASAGNAPHEVMAAVLSKMGIETGEDVNILMDAAEDILAPLMKRPLVIDKYALVIGYAGVYGSFFLHAKRVAEKFGVDERELLYELGRQKIIGGQEDKIIEFAYNLSKKIGSGK